MASFKIRFDKPRFEKLVTRLQRLTKDFINPKTGNDIGVAAVSGMLNLISKGISPIRGGPSDGKFAPYKSVSESSRFKKLASGATTKLKKTFKNKAKEARRGYPYSVQGKYPEKKPRPVNLYLTGSFLDALDFVYMGAVGRSIGRTIVYIRDIKDESGVSAKTKEYGHRYGANGQPKRPIMPIQDAGEKLAATIDAKIAKILRARLKELLNNK